MPQKPLTTELEIFFGEKRLSVSRQAFSKARYKISPLAFKDIFKLSTDLFQFTNHPKTWDGYRVFAVDGSEIAVAHNKNNVTVHSATSNACTETAKQRFRAGCPRVCHAKNA